MRLLGREVPITGRWRGDASRRGDGAAASLAGVRRYITRAFGNRLDEVRQAMEELATAFEPIGFRLRERFRPEVPEGVRGWGAKGELRLERI